MRATRANVGQLGAIQKVLQLGGEDRLQQAAVSTSPQRLRGYRHGRVAGERGDPNGGIAATQFPWKRPRCTAVPLGQMSMKAASGR